MSTAMNGEHPRAAWGPGPLLDRDISEFVLDSLLLTDAQGIVLDVNAAACQLFQVSKAFLIGKPLGMLVTAPDRPAFYACLTRLPTSDTSDSLELRVTRRGDEPREVQATAAAVSGSAGDWPSAYWWTFRDVTGARRTERELRSQQQLLEGIVDAAEAIILLVDRSGRVLRSNTYLHDVTGCDADDLRGRDWCFTLLAPDDRPAGRRIVAQAVSHGIGRSGPLALRIGRGPDRSVAWSARGLDGMAPGRVVLIGHDVTELQEAQARIVRAERLAAIGQMAAGLAHESRNALQRGQACLSMLGLRLADRPEVADLLERAQKAQDDLHRLYEGLLNYAAPLRLDVGNCDLPAVWREAWADLASTPNWGDAVLVEVGDPADAHCLCDGFHLRRVFRNLFENARAAVTGPLQVTVRWSAADLRGRPAVRVGVRDNGPGFPQAARRRLFEAFLTTKIRGTGLGLALCKRVVDEHGGQIEAGFNGPGAEVIITLPRSIPS